MRAAIAFGSNLGDRLANLKTARARLRALVHALSPFFVSAVYETEAVGCEPGAPRFLNAVMEIGYSGEALELLRELRALEAEMGRPPAHPLNASRKIDLDLLYFGDTRIATEELMLPHPRMQLRRFVLQPLAEIRPDLILPGQTENVSALLARLPEAELVRAASQW